MTTSLPAITRSFERAPSAASGFMAYADADCGSILSKVMVLSLLGLACNALGGWWQKRKIRRHEKDLLGRGFPPELARQVALLLVEDRLKEATALLRKAREERAAEGWKVKCSERTCGRGHQCGGGIKASRRSMRSMGHADANGARLTRVRDGQSTELKHGGKQAYYKLISSCHSTDSWAQ